MKRIMLLGVMLCLIIGTIAVAETAVPQTPNATPGGTLTIGVSQTFQNLDPRIGKGNYDRIVMNNIFDPLFGKDPKTLAPVPYVASGWEINEAGTEITFYLNEGITFHNGEALTAEDVAYTFNWIANPDNGSPNQLEFNWLQEVAIVNEYTVIFRVKPEEAPFPPLFAGETWSIVPKDTVEQMGAEAFALNPIGSGPYKFVQWIAGEKVVLERNEDYWLVRPNLDKIVFRPIPETATMMAELEAGGIDVADTIQATDVERFRAMDQIEVQQAPSVLYYYLAFNHSHSPGNDYRFRRALSQAVDWDGAVFSVFRGITATRMYGALAPTIWANDIEFLKERVTLPYDPKTAAKLFAELKAAGVFPTTRPVRILTPLDPNRVTLGEIAATALKQNGIDTEVRPLDWGPLLDTIYRSEADPLGESFDMYIIGQGVGPDPYYYLDFLFNTDQAIIGTPNNKSWYSNVAVDVLLNAAAQTFDQEKREELYKQAQRIIFTDVAHIPLYTKQNTQGINTRVHDFTTSAISSRMDLCTPFNNVWIEE